MEDDADRVKVIARFRPFNAKELTLGSIRESEEMFEYTESGVFIVGPGQPKMKFILNRVFDKAATQNDVYEYFGQSTVEQMLEGFNVTIFAYGQTGAGKSFSMLGDTDDPEKQGIIPRVAQDIFDRISDVADSENPVEFTISCSYLEVYQEQIKDLLTRNSKNLTIRESPSQGVYVDGLSVEYVGSPDDILDLLAIGDRLKKVASTNMNMRSSRSHSCFICKILQRDENGCTKEATLNLVDLAGSERIKKTGASGQTLEEAKKINLSLTCLSQCIHALTDSSKTHVPFRGSKLTRLLQESLGGNSKTTVLVACSPHVDNLEETVCTLRFAERCKRVTNKAKENVQLSPAQLMKMCQQLSDEIANLKLYTVTLEGALKRLGVDPKGLENGTLELTGKPKAVYQTIEKSTQVTPRPDHGQHEDLITTYEHQSVIVPSKHILQKNKLNDLPPPGQTYVTSTVKLQGYSPETFKQAEQTEFLKAVVAAMDNDEISLEHCTILEITAGSVNVTFRVQAPAFLASSVSESIQGNDLVKSLTAQGINTKGMTVTKKPFLTRGVVRPKDTEEPLEQRRTSVDGMPTMEFFNREHMKLKPEQPMVPNEELEKLSNQIVDLKAENEALLSDLEDHKRIIDALGIEKEQADVQVDALHDKIRMLADKVQQQQPLDESDMALLREQVRLINQPDGSARQVAVVPEPSQKPTMSGSIIIEDESSNAQKPRLGGRRHQGVPQPAQRKGRKVDGKALTSIDLEEPPKLETSESSDTLRSARRVPQLFVPMDQSSMEGEYKTFVATDYAEPVVQRRRDDDEFDAVNKVKELQSAVDRQSDIIERQSILLAHQDKLNKQHQQEVEALRQEKSELEAQLSDYEMRLLDAVREVQPGVTSKDYRGMGYAGNNRPKNIRMPLRNQDSLLGPTPSAQSSRTATVRSARTQRTSRAADRPAPPTQKKSGGMMSGVFSIISDILEFEKDDEPEIGIKKAQSTPVGHLSPNIRSKNRNERAQQFERPKSPQRDAGISKFSVGNIFRL